VIRSDLILMKHVKRVTSGEWQGNSKQKTHRGDKMGKKYFT